MYLKAGGLVLVVVLSFLAYFAFAETYSVKNEYSNFSLVDLTDANPANVSIKRNYTFINISIQSIAGAFHTILLNNDGEIVAAYVLENRGAII